MASDRDPRTSTSARLAADYYPVSLRPAPDDSTPAARKPLPDDDESAGSGITAAETIGFVVALVVVVVLVALI